MRRPLSSTTARVACVLVALGLLGACAHPEGPHGDYGGDAPRGAVGRAGLNLFISPAGKPFRAGADAPYAIADWFATADANHDGRLTRAEFRADADAFFHELDANQDGVIDGFEVQAYEQKIAPEILPRLEGLHADEGMDPRLLHGGARSRPGGGPDGPAPSRERIRAGDSQLEGAGVYSVLNEPEPVTAADRDFTGQITLSEWRAKADARFTLLDTTNAGFLTLATLPKTAAQALLERRRRADAKRRGVARPRA